MSGGATLGENVDPAPPRTAVAGAGLLDAEQLDLEDEGGRRGNDRRKSALAVRVVRGARQLGNLPDGRLAIPSSHPLMTWPTPMVNWKGWPRSLELSNLEPFVRVPAFAVDAGIVDGASGRVEPGAGRREATRRGGISKRSSPVHGFDIFAGGVAMRTGVVGGDDLPGLGEGHAVARLEGLDVYAHLANACVRPCVRAGRVGGNVMTRTVVVRLRVKGRTDCW